ncbi:MAG: hypothetical protein KY475_24940 [Planctomycetes bacterium]|nr:hypothetical protein [Planctomycetota bacterium]
MRNWTLLRPPALGAALLFFSFSTQAPAGDLTVEAFRTLQEELQPSPDDAWRTIPWKIALLDARRAAAEEEKPIFIWAMDGHPLGCT